MLVGVAVVGGDEQRRRPGPSGSAASTRGDGVDDPAEAAVDDARAPSTVASQTPVWPTMSGFAKLATMKS